jgi:hypothetical protein
MGQVYFSAAALAGAAGVTVGAVRGMGPAKAMSEKAGMAMAVMMVSFMSLDGFIGWALKPVQQVEPRSVSKPLKMSFKKPR